MRNVVMRIFLLVIIFSAVSCKSNAQEFAPYIASGEFEMNDNSSDYSICGVNVFILNKRDTNIKQLTLVFYLFDNDGEPATECWSKLEFEIEKEIAGSQSASFCVSLDKYMNVVPSEKLFVDYLYLSKIEYDDGSVWEDPAGLIAFR